MSESIKVDSYEGICRQCFKPVKNGTGQRFRDEGMLFHSSCIENHPNGYWIKIEAEIARREDNERLDKTK